MMHIHFNRLILQCRRSKEIIDLTAQISFFHGKISSGKSSIARLITYCLGSDLEKTPAINKELISVTLDCVIGEYQVLLERLVDATQIRTTWVSETGEMATVLAKVNAEAKPIWGDSIFNISDLVMYLMGIGTIKIPSNQNLEEADLMRLSIRNFLWYCYLDQHHLDSSFFRFEDPIKRRSSRAVFKYAFQLSSEKLINLESTFINVKDERLAKTTSVQELTQFLSRVGYSSVEDIQTETNKTTASLEKYIAERKKLEAGYLTDTHSSDITRNQIRTVLERIDAIESALYEQEKKIEEQTSLRAELISSKFKLARTESVTSILSGVDFSNCPACGTLIEDRKHDEMHCGLCTSELKKKVADEANISEAMKIDLDNRILEIEDSIQQHKKVYGLQKRQLKTLLEQRKWMDDKLAAELFQYESVYLSNIRRIDQQIATLRERIKGNNRIQEFPLEIRRLEDHIKGLEEKEGQLKEEIAKERSSLLKADEYIKDLEGTFLEILQAIRIPGINEDDVVVVNRTTLEPMIVPVNDPDGAWNFHNAGSGGKKTLFNVCYMLAIHLVTSRHNLPLPNFMIVDTPMKNIDKEINEDIFKAFYDYLYAVADGELDNTQFIIIDNAFIAPKNKDLSFSSRYMTPDDADHPPLISYYRGS